MLNSFQRFLYDQIPLTKKMGLTIVELSEKQLTIQAPLAKNINDKGSVFGGSSSALMILAGWSLIKLNCEKYNIKADIVIHKNETIWQKPLFQNLIIQSKFKFNHDFPEIKSRLVNKKHQRIECLIKLTDADTEIFSTMKAKYVIIPPKFKE